MQDLSTDPEDDPTCQHDGKGVLVATEAEDEMPQNAKTSSDDHHPPSSDFIDHNPTEQRNDHVGKGVESVEQIELEFGEVVPLSGLVLLDRYL